jgi:Pectate lyase superfamily protein
MRTHLYIWWLAIAIWALCSCQKNTPHTTATPAIKPANSGKNARSAEPKAQTNSPQSRMATKTGSFVDISKFGAIPNDNKDDFSAISTVIGKLKQGDTLFIPKGTFLISDAVIVKTADVLILGVGKESILQFNNAQDLYKKYSRRAGFFNIAANNCTVTKVCFDQNYRGSGRKNNEFALASSLQIGTAFIKRVNVTDLIVTSCLFYDYYGDAVSVFNASCQRVEINDNEFVSSAIVQGWKDHYVQGEQAINIASGEDVNIINNRIKGCLDDCIAVHNHSSNILIKDNQMTTFSGRIIMGGTTNGRIENNRIEVLEDAPSCILLSYPFNADKPETNKNITIAYNEMIINRGVKVPHALRLIGAGDSIIIKNNTITFLDIPGIGIQLLSKKSKKANQIFGGSNIEITNNTINNASIAIEEPNVKNHYTQVKINKNTITGGNKKFQPGPNWQIKPND